jgi:hypothetical protein
LGSQVKAQRAFEEAVQYQSWAKHRLCPAQHMLRIKRLFSSVLLKIGIIAPQARRCLHETCFVPVGTKLAARFCAMPFQ